MTRPTAKEIKAMTDVAGVPVDDEVAARIANSIGPAFDGFAPVAGTLPFDLEPASFLLVQTAKVVNMSTEPALMSLIAVAKAIAEKKFSSREVTQSCLDRIAAVAAAPQCLHGDRGRKRRWRPPTPPMRRWRKATAAARCTACRWRTRTCITTPARS